MSELQDNTKRALVVSGFWLHVGLLGAAAVAVGLLQLFGGEVTLSALALTCSGGVLAAASWRRARRVLGQADRASAVAADAPSESASRAVQANRTRRNRRGVPYSAAIEREAR
jgi:membrane protein implicated in regulation of membrane protease activity